MSAFYALTLVVSAALLFAVQPMAARMALPTLGGAPAVWNTCMVFFQAAVLGGYFFAHALSRRFAMGWQGVLFVSAVVLGGIGLPVMIEAGSPTMPTAPWSWLFTRLTVEVGLPALVLATTSPLLQRWFATSRRDGREPFFLYAASNVGSLGALLAYPVILEPLLSLEDQTRLWTAGYGIWGVLVLLCGCISWTGGRRALKDSGTTHEAAGTKGNPWRSLVSWAALGAVPASLLQGCTLFLTTDVASVPLLWVVPLGLYLLTFVIAFGAGMQWAIAAAGRALPFLAAALWYVVVSRATQPVVVLILLHLLFLVAAGLVCHGRLVSLRPQVSNLTGFYLALATGGVLGGAFNALVAPRLFNIVAEYPIAIALACAFLPARAVAARPPRPWADASRDFAWSVAVAAGIVVLGLVVPWWTQDSPRWRDTIVFGVPAVACCTTLDRPRRLASTLGAAFLAGLWLQGLWNHTQHSERNFFGITRVTRDAGGEFNQLVHGNTIHGRQFRDPDRRREPLTYYHRRGPLGWIFEGFEAAPSASDFGGVGASGPHVASRRVGVIGLGIGSMAAYAQPGEDWQFFEINPAVIRIAQNTNWFTFLADARAGRLRIEEGDGRLLMGAVPDGTFNLVVLDAFSSDAIPVHLLTREALEIYFRKLRPGGWLAAHISNRYLNLEPVFAALARDAGVVCRAADDTDEGTVAGKEPSHWILMARKLTDLGVLARQSRWVPAEGSESAPVWTDQRTAILPLFDWH